MLAIIILILSVTAVSAADDTNGDVLGATNQQTLTAGPGDHFIL